MITVNGERESEETGKTLNLILHTVWNFQFHLFFNIPSHLHDSFLFCLSRFFLRSHKQFFFSFLLSEAFFFAFSCFLLYWKIFFFFIFHHIAMWWWAQEFLFFMKIYQHTLAILHRQNRNFPIAILTTDCVQIKILTSASNLSLVSQYADIPFVCWTFHQHMRKCFHKFNLIGFFF